MRRVNSVEPEHPMPSIPYMPLSYAQVASPSQHGVKRTTSEREALSPIEHCPKRTVHSCKVEAEEFSFELNTCSPSDQNSLVGETPDHCTTNSKASYGRAQRRLFTSPKTTTSPVQGNRYGATTMEGGG